MEAFGPFMNGWQNVHNELWEHIRAKSFQGLALGAAHMDTPEAGALRDRGRVVREAFLAGIGGLPEAEGPPEATIEGIVDRDGYRIEKIVYQSLPDVYVTAHLYVPAALQEPAPAVLFVCGHAQEAKCSPEYQRCCHDFAINGFVVLAIDPPGQGERMAFLNPDTREIDIGWGTTEHCYQGDQCILTGSGLARYFLFDALRALDYLAMRPEVNVERIGITGNSGGGTQTTLVCMSGEPRIKAAAPCTYVTARENMVLAGIPQDAEQVFFNMTGAGINYDDFFLPYAPRPLLIGAVRSDFFPPSGTHLTFERLQGHYRALGMEENVALAWGPGRHMYNRALRKAVVNWFRRHLSGEKNPDFVSAQDSDISVLPGEELWCTPKGHVPTAYPRNRSPYHLNLGRLDNRTVPATDEALRLAVIGALRIGGRVESQAGLFPVTQQEQVVTAESGVQLNAHSIFFQSEPGISCAGCLLWPVDTKPENVVVYISVSGTAAMDGAIAACGDVFDKGTAVFVLDVRGVGSVTPQPINTYGDTFPNTFYNTDNWLATLAYMAGENLLGMRVFDVLRAARLMGERGFARIDLRAGGLQPALWAYFAGALDSTVAGADISDLIESYEAVCRSEKYRTDITPSALVYGILNQCDLPDIERLYAGRDLDVRAIPVARTTV